MKFILQESTEGTFPIHLELMEDGGFEVVSGYFYLVSVNSEGRVTINENPMFGLSYDRSTGKVQPR